MRVEGTRIEGKKRRDEVVVGKKIVHEAYRRRGEQDIMHAKSETGKNDRNS